MATTGSFNSFARMEALVSMHGIAHLSNASATWWPGGIGVGNPVPGLRVIFDREFGDAAGGVVNDANPAASVLEADAPGVARNHTMRITRDGESLARDYRVLKASPDGTGWVLLELQELGA